MMGYLPIREMSCALAVIRVNCNDLMILHCIVYSLRCKHDN